MKIVLLCGSQQNQIALANKVARSFNLSGIIVEDFLSKKKPAISLNQQIEKLLNRTVFISIRRAWLGLMMFYKLKYPSFPDAKKIFVSNINDDSSVKFIKALQPDLVMVSGTSIIKDKILGLSIPLGIINLHTGLSPYIKGGPNCTNWCLANEQFYLIGNTIMWIDAGIDSGNIITTETTEFNGKENLIDIHIKVMEHAHELYLRTLHKIENKLVNKPGVQQNSIDAGTTYYNRQWNWKAKWRLLKNVKKFRNYFEKEKYKNNYAGIVTINL